MLTGEYPPEAIPSCNAAQVPTLPTYLDPSRLANCTSCLFVLPAVPRHILNHLSFFPGCIFLLFRRITTTLSSHPLRYIRRRFRCGNSSVFTTLFLCYTTISPTDYTRLGNCIFVENALEHSSEQIPCTPLRETTKWRPVAMRKRNNIKRNCVKNNRSRYRCMWQANPPKWSSAVVGKNIRWTMFHFSYQKNYETGSLGHCFRAKLSLRVVRNVSLI